MLPGFEAHIAKRVLYIDGAIPARTEVADAELTYVVGALRDGMSIRETGDALGMHKSKVERLKKKAVGEGLLDG